MIERLQLENFRGFSDHTVPLKGLTLMVGANNAGKSTVVEALRLVGIVGRALRGSIFVPPPSWLDHPEAFRGVAPNTRGMEFDSESFFHRYQAPPAVVTATFTSGGSVVVFVGPEGEVHGVFRDGGGHAVGSASAARALSLPTVAVQPQVAPLLRVEPIRARPTVTRAVGSYLTPQHFRNQLKYFFEDFEEFRRLAERTWPRLQIQELVNRDGAQGDPLALTVRDDDFVGEVSWMGHGLQMWLQTM
jgi:hypothetical protein